MSNLSGKRILLCVSAGIAAYKSCELVRRLIEAGATVQVAMTPRAQAFVTPLTLQALSGRAVRTELFDSAAEAAMGHIELARWADVVVVAPASADLLARLTHGLADDLVTTLCLATRAPLWVAPAMNHQMWNHPATTANVALLQTRGVRLLGPDSGPQACGEFGPGRMLEPAQIVAELVAAALSGDTAGPRHGPAPANGVAPANSVAATNGPAPATARTNQPPTARQLLAGRKVVITAGPTREALDPVRYISNHSSGKQGFAVAAAAAAAGAHVTLIAGPVQLATPAGVDRVDVLTARDMHAAVLGEMPGCDVFVAVAAVADYRPLNTSASKIKKAGDGAPLTLELVENPDVVGSVGALPTRPFIVGFAAETDNLLQNARDKRQRKNMDLIVLNNVADTEIGFSSDNNAVTFISASSETHLPKAPKAEIASELIKVIAACLSSSAVSHAR